LDKQHINAVAFHQQTLTPLIYKIRSRGFNLTLKLGGWILVWKLGMSWVLVSKLGVSWVLNTQQKHIAQAWWYHP